MILKKINKSLKRRTLRKKGGSGKRLNLNIEDEKGQKLYVPVEEDTVEVFTVIGPIERFDKSD